MNERNYDYLSNQIKFSGFGEAHGQELKDKLQKQTPEFTIFHNQEFGKDTAVATLNFRKSTDTDMYFFNRYTLLVKNDQHPEAKKQTFYMGNKEDNITLKEGYNLLSGRAVHKELSTKEGEKYNAWIQLDLNTIDKNGNHETKRFHENYGFDLDKAIAKYPIKELSDETEKGRLMASLERGNRQSVTLRYGGKEQKAFIEAAPQFRSFNLYDTNHNRIQIQPTRERIAEAPEGKEQSTTASLKSGKTNQEEDGDGPPQSQKKSRRKANKVS